MASIPEFVLRKLYVSGSLKPIENGFTFELNNTFAAVNLLGLSVSVDESACLLENIFIGLTGKSELCATDICGEHPFTLPVNEVVSVFVKESAPQKKLTIRADTREAGVLEFSIPLGGFEDGQKTRKNILKKIGRRFQYANQVFRVQQDPQHPVVHFTPPANWMNDPNGLIYWQGKYHLFYQYNPVEPAWGNLHWGHAVSKDMLHWKHLPIALWPDPNGADAGGCFSGCAVDYDGIPAILYTGVYPETQCLATSQTPDLMTWKKYPAPVISAPPTGMNVEGFRDPCVWKEGSEWRMVLGSGIHAVGGAILLYRSTDLVQWQYLGVLFQGDKQKREPIWSGTMWECPSFFKLGDKWVLIISACSSDGGINTQYFTGDYVNNQFIPEGDARLLDFGSGCCFYAPQTFLDAQGRRVMFGWLREARNAAEQTRAGWSGAMSLPRILSLGSDGVLQCAPLEQTASLRSGHELLTQPDQLSESVRGNCMEMLIKVSQATRMWSGAILSAGNENAERVQIGFDPDKSMVIVDCRLAGGVVSEVQLEKVDASDISLHVFVDGSVLEIFMNDRLPVSARFYMKKAQALRVRLVGEASIDLWQLKI